MRSCHALVELPSCENTKHLSKGSLVTALLIPKLVLLVPLAWLAWQVWLGAEWSTDITESNTEKIALEQRNLPKYSPRRKMSKFNSKGCWKSVFDCYFID